MARGPIPTHFFVLVAVRREDQFLLIHERKHGELWYLPAGRVKPGESFISAARRETLEEAGIPVEVDGVLRMEYSPSLLGTRVRLIFTARPADDSPPKSVADEESLEARWFTIEELKDLPLRGPEVLDIYYHLARDGFVAPLSLLGEEGVDFTRSGLGSEN